MTNLISNPYFSSANKPDTDPVFKHWNDSGISTVSVNTSNPYSSPNAAQINPGGYISQFVTLKPGNYTLTFYAAYIGTTTPTLNMSIIPYSFIRIDSMTITPHTTYQKYTTNFTYNSSDGNPVTIYFQNTGGSSSGDVLLDNVVLVPSIVICYSGNSLVHARNTITGEIGDIPVNQIYSDIHEVFSTKRNTFVPIKLNIISGPTRNLRCIKKNALGENKPNEDFYVTPGHVIMIEGEFKKVRDIPQAEKYRPKDPELVYSLCIDKSETILVNNLSVLAWGYNKWLKNAEDKQISWKDNIKPTMS